jgi:hypothetical protein
VAKKGAEPDLSEFDGPEAQVRVPAELAMGVKGLSGIPASSSRRMGSVGAAGSDGGRASAFSAGVEASAGEGGAGAQWG